MIIRIGKLGGQTRGYHIVNDNFVPFHAYFRLKCPNSNLIAAKPVLTWFNWFHLIKSLYELPFQTRLGKRLNAIKTIKITVIHKIGSKLIENFTP